MSQLKINTDIVNDVAEKIKLYNTQINDNFSTIETAIARLDNCWDGEVATTAIKKFKEIKAEFYEARYKVVDNYVRYLLQQVGVGYQQTEGENVSLAEQFK